MMWLDRWPADGTELLLRLNGWWSYSTWLMVTLPVRARES